MSPSVLVWIIAVCTAVCLLAQIAQAIAAMTIMSTVKNLMSSTMPLRTGVQRLLDTSKGSALAAKPDLMSTLESAKGAYAVVKRDKDVLVAAARDASLRFRHMKAILTLRRNRA